jgi:hypothetical protein
LRRADGAFSRPGNPSQGPFGPFPLEAVRPDPLPGAGRVLAAGIGNQSRGSGFRVTIAAWLVSPSRWSFAPASTAAMDKTRWAETGAPAHQRVIRFPREALGSASETGHAAKRRGLNPGIDRISATGG